MKQRVETDERRLIGRRDAYDSDWPAAWPDRIGIRFPLPARPQTIAPIVPAPPTSARTVLTALEQGTSRSIPDLLERTHLPARTLRHAVRWLEVQGKVERISHLGDARRNLVRLRSADFTGIRIADHFSGAVLC